ncbi:hypothetical protein OIU84_004826, partial [Salix udensis]
MDTLKRHLPFSGQEGLQELKKIAVRFEEKIYTAATNQSDYLRKISLKMLTMETKSQNTTPTTGNANKPLDPGASHSMPPQVHNQGQSLPIPLSANQPQARQQLSQNKQNSMSSNGVQSSAGLQPAMPPVSGLAQTSTNTVGQNANMQSISVVSPNPVGNSIGLAAVTATAFKAEDSTGKSSTLTCAISYPAAAAAEAKPITAKSVATFPAIWFANIICYAAFNDANLQNLQQQQQLMAQQNNLSSMHQQQLGPQSNVAGLQQQQLLGAQSGNSSMQTNQHSLHLMQQPKVTLQQQAQQNGNALLPNQGQQSHSQLPQIQSQTGQLHQQSNPLQHDLQQRLQASGSLLQQPNGIDQQKQLYQTQGALPETPSTPLDSTAETGHGNGADWQEEIYQKIKVMKETYFPEINEMYQRIAAKLQQHDSHPQQLKPEQLDRLKVFKAMLERLITFLQVSKNNITPNLEEKLGSYEREILSFLNPSRLRKPITNLQQGQLPQPHVQPMQQPQYPVPQLQPHENQLYPQFQSMNVQGSIPMMQQNNMSSLQHGSLSSLSGVSTSRPNMMNTIQPGSNLDSGQGNALSSLQQTSVGSVQQNP